MQCNSFSTKTSVVKEQLYRDVIRQSSTLHSKEFRALKLDQMPFDQISKLLEMTIQTSSIAATNAFDQEGNDSITSDGITTIADIIATQLSSKYLQAFICNEMALLCYILSIGSDTAIVKELTRKA